MAALSQLRQQGYVVMRSVLDAGLVAEMNSHVAWLLKKVMGREDWLKESYFLRSLMS